MYNRGVDKRSITIDTDDSDRFLKSLTEFNTLEPIGSIFENSFESNKKGPGKKLVKIICYCLNNNHFHLMLEQVSDKGIEKFMHRLGTGYSKYFNNRHKRNGALFQGAFKSVHVLDNNYLLHLSAYINLNNLAHSLGRSASKLVRSSWKEYLNRNAWPKISDPTIILKQFKDIKEYEKFTGEALELIREKKDEYQELKVLFLEE